MNLEDNLKKDVDLKTELNSDYFSLQKAELNSKISVLNEKLKAGLKLESDSKEYLLSREYYNIDLVQKDALEVNEIVKLIEENKVSIDAISKQINYLNLDLVEERIQKKEDEINLIVNNLKTNAETKIDTFTIALEELKNLKKEKEFVVNEVANGEPLKKDLIDKLNKLNLSVKDLEKLKNKILSKPEKDYLNMDLIAKDNELLNNYKEELKKIELLEAKYLIEKAKTQNNPVIEPVSNEDIATDEVDELPFDTSNMTKEQIEYFKHLDEMCKNVKTHKKIIKPSLQKIKETYKMFFEDKKTLTEEIFEELKAEQEIEETKIITEKKSVKILKVIKLIPENITLFKEKAEPKVKEFFSKKADYFRYLKDKETFEKYREEKVLLPAEPKKRIIEKTAIKKILKLPEEKTKQFSNFVKPKVAEALLKFAAKLSNSNPEEENSKTK